jgi:GDPmannose 4,6-dehydratase
VEEKGRDAASGGERVCVDPRYFRPAEVDRLCGDASKARRALGWSPRVDVHKLVELMVDHDLELARGLVHLASGGYRVNRSYE